ncbi:MAG: hypothetical protein LBL87_08275 [Ruminococcus sp.]|jgi:hypothetical protein|nr:hypothetical protein [Ruminococcus sp.]
MKHPLPLLTILLMSAKWFEPAFTDFDHLIDLNKMIQSLIPTDFAKNHNYHKSVNIPRKEVTHMKTRIPPLILALSLVLVTLSACDMFLIRQADFVLTFDTVELDPNTADVSVISFAPTDGGFFAVFGADDYDERFFTSKLAFVDGGGIVREKTLYETRDIKEARYYGRLWETKDKTLTLIYALSYNQDENGEIEIHMEEYDTDFNLLRSKNITKVLYSNGSGFVFDGEYYYYYYDDPTFNSSTVDPNAEMRVYKLNSDFEIVDEMNPSDSETNPTMIDTLVLGGDGKVYVFYTENNALGFDRRMKAFGEDKFAQVGGDVVNSYTINGDENALFYGVNNNGEIFTIAADGSVASVVLGDLGEFSPQNILGQSSPKDGKRYLLSTFPMFMGGDGTLSLTTVTAEY